MEFWPADFRADATSSKRQRRKGKEVYRLKEHWVEPGTLGAATLILGKTPPQWINIVQPTSKNLPQRLGQPVEVFPPTKAPPIDVPKLTAHQRAEQGARFLRRLYPDVDISFELIKDELESDEEEAVADSRLDPYAGNRLASFSMETRRKHFTPFLAFACGETGSDLNLSPFRQEKDKRFIFGPSAAPTLVFDTPIQQIESFSPKGGSPQTLPLLAVRTHAAVTVVKLQAPARHVEGPPVAVKLAMPIPVSETGNRRIVDMSCGLYSTSGAQVLLVNDIGVVYNCGIRGGSKTISPAPVPPVSDDSELDHFWRLAWRDPNTCMRVSGKEAHIFDLRARTALPRELFHLQATGEYLTSLNIPFGGRHNMCFSTTSKLLWFDERNFKRPLLSLKHQRAFDRSLRVQAVTMNSTMVTMLTSALNSVVTIYDVNYAASGHIQLYGGPFVLPGPPRLDTPVAGSLFYRSSEGNGSVCSHFQLSSRGSLWRTIVGFSSDPMEHIPDSADAFQWTSDIQALATRAETMSEPVGTLGGREYIDVDLRQVYEDAFDVHRDPDQAAKEDPEVVYQTLEKIPFFWQDMNEPAENMLTSFDVVFQSSLEPLHASRADFLTGSLLNSPRGFLALIRGRLPIPRLVSTARWSYDISSLPPAMVPNLPVPSHLLVNQLLEEGQTHVTIPQGMQRVTESTQQLVFDLALSRHVYAPQSFSAKHFDVHNEQDGSDALSEATKAMSLGVIEPPPVHLSFLHPVAKVQHEDKDTGNEIEPKNDMDLIPLGARLLIHEWEIGSNPEEYYYKDPYVEQDVPLRAKTATTKESQGTVDGQMSKRQERIPHIVNAQRPPVIVSSVSRQMFSTQSSAPNLLTSILDTHIAPGSSPTRQPPSFFPSDDVSVRKAQWDSRIDPIASSQEVLGPSTQPLPGLFGGGNRQVGGARKKAAKKRMGGF